jgi:superfamily II DNA or RNA helicase
MRAEIVTPVRANVFLEPEELEIVGKLLSYVHTGAAQQYRRHQQNFRWKNSDPRGWKDHGEMLRAKINHTLLFQDPDGQRWVRPGSLPYLGVSPADVKNLVSYPEPRLVPWSKPLPFSLYGYQKSSVDSLIASKHANVQIATGGGKSAIILSIAKKLGLRTVVVVPSASIFGEIKKQFEHHLGKARVGYIGDGKKRTGKQFMVCISKSLCNLKPGTADYQHIADADVVISDESHLNAAETLEAVFHGLLGAVPYRFFLSGTQTRGDGTEKLLQAIIGKTVHQLSTADAIAGGYICDHEFVVVPVALDSRYPVSGDPIKVKRNQFLKNANIATFVSRLCQANASQGLQTLVLVDEVHQAIALAKLLNTSFACATGPGSRKDLGNAGVSYVSPDDAVEAFNKGDVRVLIGTGCISTGTNIYPTHATVNWQGGASEVKTKQGAVGRSVRILENSKYAELHKPKPKSVIYDFKVAGVEVLERHLKTRLEYYADSGTKIRFLNGSK